MARQAQLQSAGVRAATRRQEMIDALLARQIGQPQTITNPLEGLAHMGGTMLTAYLSKRAGDQVGEAETAAAAQRAAALQAALGGGEAAPASAVPPPGAAPPPASGGPPLEMLSAPEAPGGGPTPPPQMVGPSSPVVDAMANRGAAPAGPPGPVADVLADRGAAAKPPGSTRGGMDPMVAALLGNPDTADLGEAMALEQFKANFAGPSANIEIGDKLVDPISGKVIGDYSKPKEAPDWVQQMNSPEWRALQLELRAAGRPTSTVNVDVKGETKGSEAAWTKAAEAWDVARGAEVQANRNTPVYGQMEEALKGFQTGATAEMRLKANQILKDIGLNVEGVPEGEVIKGLSARLQFAVAPKGQGQITDFERKLIADMVPSLGTSVEGNMALIGMAKKLDDYDRKVSAIYRETARKTGSSPNPVDVADELAKLGPPLDDNEMTMLQRAQQAGGAAPPPAAAPVPPPAGMPPGAPAPPPGFVVR